MSHWLGSLGKINHGVTFNLASTKVCSSAIFETYFFDLQDIPCIFVILGLYSSLMQNLRYFFII